MGNKNSIQDSLQSCCAKRQKFPDVIEKKIQDLGIRVDQKVLGDHNPDGDDVEAISEAKLQELDRYCKFEKSFPFYRMDVNGYIVKIKMAEAQSSGENVIDLQCLREAFKNNKSWDLSDGSNLIRLFKFVAMKSD